MTTSLTLMMLLWSASAAALYRHWPFVAPNLSTASTIRLNRPSGRSQAPEGVVVATGVRVGVETTAVFVAVGTDVFVAVGGTAVFVGGTDVFVGTAVGGTGVSVGGTGVFVGTAVGGTAVLVGGTGVFVGGTAVLVGVAAAPTVML